MLHVKASQMVPKNGRKGLLNTYIALDSQGSQNSCCCKMSHGTIENMKIKKQIVINTDPNPLTQ